MIVGPCSTGSRLFTYERVPEVGKRAPEQSGKLDDVIRFKYGQRVRQRGDDVLEGAVDGLFASFREKDVDRPSVFRIRYARNEAVAFETVRGGATRFSRC